MITKPQFKSKDYKYGLYLVATPIGNLKDISFRSLEVLEKSDYILCEDTRVSKKLFSYLGIQIKKKTWLTYNDHSNEKDINAILNELDKGKIISLVSDAGTPLISDPGYKLIQRIRESKHNISNRSRYRALIFKGNQISIQRIALKRHAYVFKTLTYPF